MSAVILCIEDDATVAEVIRSTLSCVGYRVLTAGSAAEALAIARIDPPDLVLLDLILPDVNGYSFFELLRESGFENVPVMIVSGCTSPEAQALGRLLGAADYLTKPFNIRDLIARVRALLAPEALNAPAAAAGARRGPATRHRRT